MTLSERLAARRQQQNTCDRCDAPRDHAPEHRGPGLVWHCGPDYRQQPEWLRRGTPKDLTGARA